jgi:hypothetical protein
MLTSPEALRSDREVASLLLVPMSLFGPVTPTPLSVAFSPCKVALVPWVEIFPLPVRLVAVELVAM